MKSGDRARDISRHDTSLSLNDLVHGVNTLLAATGRFCLVLPVDRREELFETCHDRELYLHRELSVKPSGPLPAVRHLLEFKRTVPGRNEKREIIIEKSRRHDYTEEYRELTRDYYLAF